MVHSSRQSYPVSGILLCLLLCAQQSSSVAKPSLPVFLPQPQATAQPTVPMLDEGKGLIHLDVSVTDGNGDWVPGLNREDFQLLDEGRPQDVISFHAFSWQSARPDPPVQIILFVDTFEMSSVQTARVQLGIEQFLRQNDGHLAQPVSIFGISEDGFWTVAHHDLTDGNILASDLSYRRQSRFEPPV